LTANTFFSPESTAIGRYLGRRPTNSRFSVHAILPPSCPSYPPFLSPLVGSPMDCPGSRLTLLAWTDHSADLFPVRQVRPQYSKGNIPLYWVSTLATILSSFPFTSVFQRDFSIDSPPSSFIRLGLRSSGRRSAFPAPFSRFFSPQFEGVDREFPSLSFPPDRLGGRGNYFPEGSRFH